MDIKYSKKDTFNIAVISSFAYDEPLQAVFEAASQLPRYAILHNWRQNTDWIRNFLIKIR